MKGRGRKGRKQLLDDVEEKTRFWNLKEEAVDSTLWRIHFGRRYVPVIR